MYQCWTACSSMGSRRLPGKCISVASTILITLVLPLALSSPRALAAIQADSTQPSDPKANDLLACVNSVQGCSGTAAHTSWDHLLHNRHSCIKARRAWWSPQAPQLHVTLVTQLSVSRLQQLRAQCQTWGGPLAAVIYLPLLNPGPDLQTAANRKLQATESDIEDLFTQSLTAPTAATCQLRILLVYETFDSERAAAVMYPVNTLRNLARLMADTPLIANIDVDMLPSLSLRDSLKRSGSRGGGGGGGGGGGREEGAAGGSGGGAYDYVKACEEQDQVFVIPAFETTCKGPSVADEAVSYTKQQLQESIQAKCLSIFRERVAPAAHNATDFERWFKASDPYSIQHTNDFEPWLIGSRTKMQWFDFRFRGYGKNKIAQVAHTAALGTGFMVHPSGFIVHRQHTESQSRKAFLRVKFKSRHNAELLAGSLYQHVEAIWAEAVAQMANGTYRIELDQAVTSCLGALAWWKGVQAS